MALILSVAILVSGQIMIEVCAMQKLEVAEKLEKAGGKYDCRLAENQPISAAAVEGNEGFHA